MGDAPTGLVSLIADPVITGFVEGVTIIGLSSVFVPLILRRNSHIRQCLHLVDECARCGRELVEHKERGHHNRSLEDELTTLRSDLGKLVPKAFRGHPELGALETRIGHYRTVLGYGEQDSERPPPQDAAKKIREQQQSVKNKMAHCANKYMTWVFMKDFESTNHH